MRRRHCFPLSYAMLLACSSTRQEVAQRADEHDDVGAATAAEAGTSRAIDAEIGTSEVNTSESAVASSNSARNDAEASSNAFHGCPSLGFVIPLDSPGEIRVAVRFWEGNNHGVPYEVDAELIWTPGSSPDPSNPWPEPLPEAEWDRSETPLDSCTVWLRNVPTECYDLTTSSLTFGPPSPPRVVYYNLSDQSAGYNSTHRCDYQPGCRYPYELGYVDGYYVVSEGNDTRVVICGLKSGAFNEAAFSLSPKTQPTCEPSESTQE
jgi:hypothetical protein